MKLISENLDNIESSKTEISGSCGLKLMVFCTILLASPNLPTQYNLFPTHTEEKHFSGRKRASCVYYRETTEES